MSTQYPSQCIFPALTAAFLATRFSKPFHIHAKGKIGKKKLFSSQQGLNPHPCTYQTKAKPFNQSRFHDNSYNSRNLSSPHVFNI